jgi:hypothetical protein
LANDVVETLFSGEPNLTTTERVIYVGLGLGIAAAGAKPRPNPLLNVLALAAGSYLAWSGYQGHCPVKALMFEDGEPKKLAAQHS